MFHTRSVCRFQWRASQLKEEREARRREASVKAFVVDTKKFVQ